MELFEVEAELYNSKMRLFSWIFEEIQIHPEKSRELINQKGQELPLNL